MEEESTQGGIRHKHGVKHDDTAFFGSHHQRQQKRREKQDAVRKSNRDKVIQAKRRKLDDKTHTEANSAHSVSEAQLAASLQALQRPHELKYSDAMGHLRFIRQALAQEHTEAPIDYCLQNGVITALEWALQPVASGGIASAPGGVSELRFEASWIVANLATGNSEQTKKLGTVVPLQLHLLDSDDIQLTEQITWTLGNISGDVQEWRNWLINNGCLHALQRQLRSKQHKELIRVTCWTLSNLLRGNTSAKPFLDVQIPQLIIEIMAECLDSTINNSDQGNTQERLKILETLTECSWVVAYLAAREEEVVEVLVQHKVIPLLVRCLSKGHPPLILPTLRSLGNISGCPDHRFTSEILAQPSFLSVLHTIVSSPFVSSSADETVGLAPSVAAQTPNKQVRVKEALWVCANIAAGTIEHLQALLRESFIPTIVQHLESGWRVRTQAGLVLFNVALGMLQYCENGGDASFVRNTVDELLRYENVLPTFIGFMKAPDMELVKMSLVFCEMVLRFGNRGTTLFENNDGIAALENVVHHGPGDEDSQQVFDKSFIQSIREKASSLLDEYFGEDADDTEPAFEAPAIAQPRNVNFLPAWMENQQ